MKSGKFTTREPTLAVSNLLAPRRRAVKRRAHLNDRSTLVVTRVILSRTRIEKNNMSRVMGFLLLFTLLAMTQVAQVSSEVIMRSQWKRLPFRYSQAVYNKRMQELDDYFSGDTAIQAMYFALVREARRRLAAQRPRNHSILRIG